jgi:hypothetical protein
MVSFVTKVSSVPKSTIVVVATMVTSVYVFGCYGYAKAPVGVSRKDISRLVTLRRLSSKKNSGIWHVGLITLVVLSYFFTG